MNALMHDHPCKHRSRFRHSLPTSRPSTVRTIPRRPCVVACTVALVLLVVPPARTQDKKPAPAKFQGDPALLSIERIFGSNALDPEKAPPVRWRKRGSGYVTLEPLRSGQQLVG